MEKGERGGRGGGGMEEGGRGGGEMEEGGRGGGRMEEGGRRRGRGMEEEEKLVLNYINVLLHWYLIVNKWIN